MANNPVNCIEMPESINVITSKRYNEHNKLQLISLSRTLYGSIKLILVAGFSSLSILSIYNHRLEGIIIIVLILAQIVSFIVYVISYQKIVK